MKIWTKIKEFLNNKNNSDDYDGYWPDAEPVAIYGTNLPAAGTSPTAGVSKQTTFIKVRTDFEGYHFYPGAGKIDSRIKFLELEHRHTFKVEVKISVTHLDRELEFFLVKWALQDFIKEGNQNHRSCEMIATDILEKHLLPTYGRRYYEITVSEDGESDGIIEYTPQ
jgi:hypothetical protein